MQLFDFIHSLDSKKLAIKLNQYQKEMNKKIKFFIQVNLAEEEQKSGISLNEISNFYSFCTKELQLNIIGLMCLPPINSNAKEYFETSYDYDSEGSPMTREYRKEMKKMIKQVEDVLLPALDK